MTSFSGKNWNDRKAVGPESEGRESPSNYPAYPEYIDSGIEWFGDMPAHWSVKRLRHIMEINPGKREFRTLPEDTTVSFLPMEAVGEDGSLDLSEKRKLSDVLEGYTPLKENDVTFAKITPCFENGKGAIMQGLDNGIGFGTTELTVLRANGRQVIPEYLYRIVAAQPFRELGESEMYGAGGQKRVPDNFVRDFAIAIPPLDEQEKITDFLDHETARIDALIEEQQRLIELLQEKRQAVISHAVTKGLDPDVPMKDSGVEWLGEVPGHWSVTPLKWRARSRSGEAISAQDFSVDSDVHSSLPVIGGNGVMGYTERSNVEPPVLVLGRVGALCGNVHEVFDPAWVTDNALMLSVDSRYLDLNYLGHILRVRDLNDLADRTAQPLITGGKVLNQWCPMPSKAEQRRIVDWLNSKVVEMDALFSKAQTSIRLLKERRSALISAAVTGKIDVRTWQPSEEVDLPEYAMVAEEPAGYGAAP